MSMRERHLMEGSEAIAEAAIAAGCRFFSGYPMTPFTEVLECFAKRLPEEGGACINSESELEAIGQAWGAAATGARAATGSVALSSRFASGRRRGSRGRCGIAPRNGAGAPRQRRAARFSRDACVRRILQMFPLSPGTVAAQGGRRLLSFSLLQR